MKLTKNFCLVLNTPMPQTLQPWPMRISIKIPKKNPNTKEISKKMIIGNKKLCFKLIGPVPDNY